MRFAVAAAVAASFVAGAAAEGVCGRNVGKCPEASPCCQQYGACGVGAYCLGGCDPLWSNSLESCMPIPVCKSKKYTFENMKNIQKNTEYLGDSEKYDWVSQGEPAVSDGILWLTMGPETVGTVMSTTHEVFYGKVKAKMRTSRGAGVVTAFILFSGAKDEIDFEWVGTELKAVQTNYYWQGVPDYTHGGKTEMGNTFNSFHDYEIDWTPDAITWSVDGQVARKVLKKDTWNSTRKDYDFPQTPSRVQLSIWPGGLATNAKGTIEWAGGEIKWSGQPDIDSVGYYYAQVKEVEIECYDPPSFVKKSGSKSYIYTDNSGSDKQIEITNKGTVMKSLYSTGTDVNKDIKKSDKDDDKKKDIKAVPGLDGVNIEQLHGPAVDKSKVNGGSSGGGSGDDSGSGGESFSDSGEATEDFIQGGSGGGSSGVAPQGGETVVKGSVFAVAVALMAMAVL